MHGNVWEWVSDWYGPYTTISKVDPTGPNKGTETEKSFGRKLRKQTELAKVLLMGTTYRPTAATVLDSVLPERYQQSPTDLILPLPSALPKTRLLAQLLANLMPLIRGRCTYLFIGGRTDQLTMPFHHGSERYPKDSFDFRL